MARTARPADARSRGLLVLDRRGDRARERAAAGDRRVAGGDARRRRRLPRARMEDAAPRVSRRRARHRRTGRPGARSCSSVTSAGSPRSSSPQRPIRTARGSRTWRTDGPIRPGEPSAGSPPRSASRCPSSRPSRSGSSTRARRAGGPGLAVAARARPAAGEAALRAAGRADCEHLFVRSPLYSPSTTKQVAPAAVAAAPGHGAEGSASARYVTLTHRSGVQRPCVFICAVERKGHDE
jgi:hypothetical protein